MRTFHYEIPLSGDLPTSTTGMLDFTHYLEQGLKDGPDCLMAYCIFPSDSDVLESISLKGQNGQFTSLNLFTYTKLYEGSENDLKACVAENLAMASEEACLKTPVTVNGNMIDHGLTGENPDILYHITEADRLPDILQNGLIPGNGSNHYKDMENHTYLCEGVDIAPWLCALPHLKHPAVVKVNTKDIPSLEPGRFFTDRSYIPDGYGEYRTKGTIPPSAIQKIDLTENTDLSNIIRGQMKDACTLALDKDSRNEVTRGLSRLSELGFDNLSSLPEEGNERYPWDNPEIAENTNKTIEALPWDDPKSFEDAINAISWDEPKQER